MELHDRLAARAALVWPSVAVDRDAFARYLDASPAGRELLAAPGDALTTERAAELWLACAIAAGSAEALARFEARYVAPLARTLGRMRLDEAELDEVRQRVRAKLLVRDAGGQVRLEAYAGAGKMAGLVQVVATREAVSLRRSSRRGVAATDEDLAGSIASAIDPGIAMLQGRAREAFRAAFAEGILALTPRQRNLLRLHLLGGVTLERLAALHAVNRSTVVRWLAEARTEVAVATKRALAASLAIRADEVSSLLGLVASQLDASFDRLLASHAPT